jgi:hypothetical protein
MKPAVPPAIRFVSGDFLSLVDAIASTVCGGESSSVGFRGEVGKERGKAGRAETRRCEQQCIEGVILLSVLAKLLKMISSYEEGPREEGWG